MAELKTKENDGDVMAFLNTVEDDQKREDCLEIHRIMQELSGSEAKMWGSSIVGYGSYHYKYASGREGDWFRVGFSPRKQNISMYIMSGVGQYHETLAKLGKYKTGKGCLYVKRLSDIDVEVLKDLIKQNIASFD